MNLFSNPTFRRWQAPGVVSAGALIAAAALWIVSEREPRRPPAVAAERGAPLLQVDRENIDFGRVPLGRWVEATFTLTNAGDGTLRFSDDPWVEIAAGC